MSSELMPHQFLHNVMESEKRPQGQPCKLYKDTVKEALCHCDIQPRKLLIEPTEEPCAIKTLPALKTGVTQN